jgi:hypothetical protein
MNILQLSKALGNRKPAILVMIERLFWESLLLIASGKMDVFRALTDFFSKVPWDKLDMISEEDQGHFADGKRILQSDYNQAAINLSRYNLAEFQSSPSVVRGGDWPASVVASGRMSSKNNRNSSCHVR